MTAFSFNKKITVLFNFPVKYHDTNMLRVTTDLISSRSIQKASIPVTGTYKVTGHSEMSSNQLLIKSLSNCWFEDCLYHASIFYSLADKR